MKFWFCNNEYLNTRRAPRGARELKCVRHDLRAHGYCRAPRGARELKSFDARIFDFLG